MRFPPRRPPLRAARWLAAWCLLAALPLHGLSATIAALLGPAHFHHHQPGVQGPLAGWQDFRRADHVGTPHAHAALDRHSHADDDASVVAVGATGQDDAAGDGARPYVAVLADAVPATPAPTEALSAGWPLPEADCMCSCDPRRLERPPRS